MPFGLIATLEGIYSKGYNNIVFENLIAKLIQILPFLPDKDPVITQVAENRLSTKYIVQQFNEGYTYNFVAQLQKQMANGYCGFDFLYYGRAKDIFPATSSTAYSNWRNLYSCNRP